MEDLAEGVLERVREEFDTGALVGVSYYTNEEVGHVYRSEWAEEKYEPEEVDAIVDDLRLASIGHGAQEQLQAEPLRATIRVYDDVLDIAVPANEVRGVAVALDTEGDYHIREIISVVEEVIETSEGDSPTT